MRVADHVETLKAKDGARFIVEIKNDRLEVMHETATDHESVQSWQSLNRTSLGTMQILGIWSSIQYYKNDNNIIIVCRCCT